MNVEKEFLPYEQALELKELGFDKECFATYEFGKIHINEFKNDCSYELCLKTEVFPAPTFSQAFRWFREKYDLFISIFHYENGYSINDLRRFETYEEAELACLNKLIEIVKKQIIMNLKDIDSEVLIQELTSRGYIRVLWHRMDIEQEADELNVVLSEDEIISIIEDIEHYHDANYGLNWDVIRDRIDNVVRNREK